ncbi:hypothetical protein VE02_05205 [Pseudogymnoascus sp. 03VT05]|nr:hypothetical protein VE02_05205 [Pseudogymnoascus sp. 03VT05]
MSVYAPVSDNVRLRSRYAQPDSAGDSRRSPRDRSPARHSDQRDGGQFNGPARGVENNYRPGLDSRSNSNFSPRDNYRDSSRGSMRDFPSREPPRGPKALGDNIPSGPRVNSFSGDFRGRGRGRGRGWRDDSRDRGPRDIDRDFRDRRDDRGPPPPFRDERSHDREWEDRDRLDRDRRDSFRGGRASKIRPSSPRGRPRSPVRNDSRDATRGRGRGRDDWEPRAGRGRGMYFDGRGEPRGRRSRSPERGDRPRQDRPADSWDKTYPQRPTSSVSVSQTRENPSPPPQAPEVPAFGSVISGAGGGQTAVGSAPVAIPTGPRSERPPASHGGRLEYPGSIQWTNPKFVAAPSKPDAATTSPVHRKAEEQQKLASSEPPKDVSHDVVEKHEAEAPAGDDSTMMEAGEVDESPKVEEVTTLTWRPPTNYVTPEDEASDSDIDDDYFEDEISKVKSQLSQGVAKNTVELFQSVSIPFNNMSQLRSPVPPPTLPEPSIEAKEAKKAKEAKEAKDNVPVKTTEVPTPMALDNVPVIGAETEEPAAILPPVAEKSPEVSTPSVELEKLALDVKPIAQPEEIEPVEDSIMTEPMLEVVRKRMATPPIADLPFAVTTPWQQETGFLKGIESDPDVMDFLVASLTMKADMRDREIEENSQIYKQKYKDWIDFHRSDNPLAVRCRERWEANRAAEVSRAASAQPAESRTEGRRAVSRFATERDIERLLRQSQIEATEQRKRQDRAAKAKAASEKEAGIPDMLSIEDREATRYGDYTNLVASDRALAMFEVLPPIADFTEWERETFEKTMLDYPKQWGKIAEALPGRNYKHCIQYYYLVKHELKLKEKLKKQIRGKGRKRKPKTSVHTVALGREEVEEEPTEGTNDRRRPRRAAAPIFGGAEPAPSESDTTPAPTPARRGAATPKEGETTATGKRKGKAAATREKATKQPKNNQLLAAAPNAVPKNQETKVPLAMPIIKEWQQPIVPPPEPVRFTSQIAPWDGPAPILPPYVTPSVVAEKPTAPIPSGHDIVPQGYPVPEHVGALPPGSAYNSDPQNQRNTAAPTSSYWSVPEQNDFPMLIEYYGTDWHGIAKWMASKTHIMVKNYYQRQIDSGRSDLEEMARIADDKRARGENLGPPPAQTNHPIKRKYDGPSGSPQRPLGLTSMDDMDEMYLGGQLPPQTSTGMLFTGGMPPNRYDGFTNPIGRPSSSIGTFEQDEKPPTHALAGQHAPSPQPGGPRYAPLAQAGSISQASNAPSRSVTAPSKHLPQAQQIVQQMQQQRPPRGPTLGYFNSDTNRPIVRASSISNPSPQPIPASDQARTTSRSHLVAQEAQAERQQALRLEEEQRLQARQQQFRMKQETDVPGTTQFEQYPPQIAQHQQRGSPMHPRTEAMSPVRAEDSRRANIGQYPPRNFQQSRNALGDLKASTGPSTPSSLASPGPPRGAPIAPPSHQHSPPVHQQPPSAPPPQPQPVAAIRQQETVRKTSSIMSLLNDEPSEPVASKLAPEPQSAMKLSPPPATHQPLYQPRQAGPPLTQHLRRESSLTDIRGKAPPQSTRPPSTSQAPAIRHNDMVYSPSSSNQTQPQSRQHVGSPLDSTAPDRGEYYAHQQYMMQQQQQHQHQQPPTSSPQTLIPYQPQQSQQPPQQSQPPQHPSHRQMAFGTSSHRSASPSMGYSHTSHHGSRHGSFDARQQQGPPPTSTQGQQQSSYSTTQHPGPAMSPPYQQQAPQQHSLQPPRFISQPPSSSQTRASPLGQHSAQVQQMPPQAAQHSYGQLPPHRAQQPSPAPAAQRSYTPVSYDRHPGPYAPPPPQQPQPDRLTLQQQRQDEEAMLRRQPMRDGYGGPGPVIDRRAEETYQRDLEERRLMEGRRMMDERRQMEEQRQLDGHRQLDERMQLEERRQLEERERRMMEDRRQIEGRRHMDERDFRR